MSSLSLFFGKRDQQEEANDGIIKEETSTINTPVTMDSSFCPSCLDNVNNPQHGDGVRQPCTPLVTTKTKTLWNHRENNRVVVPPPSPFSEEEWKHYTSSSSIRRRENRDGNPDSSSRDCMSTVNENDPSASTATPRDEDQNDQGTDAFLKPEKGGGSSVRIGGNHAKWSAFTSMKPCPRSHNNKRNALSRSASCEGDVELWAASSSSSATAYRMAPSIGSRRVTMSKSSSWKGNVGTTPDSRDRSSAQKTIANKRTILTRSTSCRVACMHSSASNKPTTLATSGDFVDCCGKGSLMLTNRPTALARSANCYTVMHYHEASLKQKKHIERKRNEDPLSASEHRRPARSTSLTHDSSNGHKPDQSSELDENNEQGPGEQEMAQQSVPPSQRGPGLLRDRRMMMVKSLSCSLLDDDKNNERNDNDQPTSQHSNKDSKHKVNDGSLKKEQQLTRSQSMRSVRRTVDSCAPWSLPIATTTATDGGPVAGSLYPSILAMDNHHHGDEDNEDEDDNCFPDLSAGNDRQELHLPIRPQLIRSSSGSSRRSRRNRRSTHRTAREQRRKKRQRAAADPVGAVLSDDSGDDDSDSIADAAAASGCSDDDSSSYATERDDSLWASCSSLLDNVALGDEPLDQFLPGE